MNAPDVDTPRTPAKPHRPADQPHDGFEVYRKAVDLDNDPAYLAIRNAFERTDLEDDGASWREWIEINPNVMVAKPVFKGTRMTVEHVLESLGGGDTIESYLQAYTHLRPEHIKAAFAFAADALRRKVPDLGRPIDEIDDERT